MRGVDSRVAALIGAAVVLLVAFPIAARLSARGLPIAPAPAATLPPLPPGPPGPKLRDLPVAADASGRPVPLTPLDEAGVRRSAARLLGSSARARRLLAEVRGVESTEAGISRAVAALARRLTPQQVAQATALGGSLTVLAAGPAARRYPAAASAAYALLDRAGRGGACAPQLNVLLLLAADRVAGTAAQAAADRARRACPGDPAPLWLLGELQAHQGQPDVVNNGDGVPEARRGVATFAAMARAFPRSPATWSGTGDALVRLAAAEPLHRLFTRRRLLERALAAYRRAAALGDDVGVYAGMAVAEAGLGRPSRALSAQRRALAARPGAAPLVAGLVEQLEGAHAFRAATAAAQRLADAPRRPRGAALFPLASDGPLAPFASAVGGPLSAGAGRLVPLTTALLPRLPLTSGVVTDLAFLPPFYDVGGVTGTDRSCPRWSAARDALLAGDPGAAQRLRSNPCQSVNAELLGAVGDLEAGDRGAARARLAGGLGDASLADAQDARQNLWRWAGALPRAERAAREWLAAGGGAKALLRLGEIEELRGDHYAAAADFAASARRARDRTRTWSAPEANALLHRGAALQAAGRVADAAAAFAQADDVASRAPAGDGLDTYDDPQWISYHARAELGDLERENGRPLDAAEQYAAARERGSVFDGHRAAVERVDNNEAIVELRLKRVPAAVERSARAVAADPSSPVFLMLNGSAQAHAGHTRAAIQAYRAALAADPTAFPAGNDLGVLLFRARDDEGATQALRRAVGAAPGYALGWFNLGAVLAHRGPLHLIASQGALARAIALDDHYRGRRAEPQLDEQVYRSGLDLSRPLPPDWTFAGAAAHHPAALVGGAALLLLALTLGRSLAGGADRRGTATEWLGRIATLAGRLPGFRMLPAVLGLAVAVAILVRTLVPESGGGAAAVVALVVSCAALVGVLAGTRRLAARRAGRALSESTWPPAVAFGIGAGAFGLAWLPLPVIRRPDPPEEGEEPPPDVRLHRAAPAAAGLLAAVLLVLSVWLDVPLTRATAIAALVAAASLLTPIRPLDGDVLSRASAAGAGLAALGLGALTLLGLS